MAEENQEVNSYAKRPLWHWLLLYVVVAVVIYGLFYYFVLAKNSGYSSNQTGGSGQGAYSTPTTSTVTQAPTSAAAAQKVTIEGNEFAFTPSTITLKKGQPAEITFKNTGKFPHNLTIADLGVATKTIQSGEQDTITFTPDKTGQFAFMCTVPGHADRGMKGTLTVQ